MIPIRLKAFLKESDPSQTGVLSDFYPLKRVPSLLEKIGTHILFKVFRGAYTFKGFVQGN